MKEVSESILIDAPPRLVWRILVEFNRYRVWNPFIVRASGRLRIGQKIEATIRTPGWKPMTFRPTICAVMRDNELRWRERLWLPGLFDREHVFTIRRLNGDRVRFTQRERFAGLLAPLARRQLLERTRRGFRSMNEALKKRAERAARR